MPSKQESRITIRPNEKARVYLEALGYLDKRTGRKLKRQEGSLNQFVNELIILACESEKHPKRAMANHNDLKAAWRKYSIAMRNREIMRLQQEIEMIADWKGE